MSHGGSPTPTAQPTPAKVKPAGTYARLLKAFGEDFNAPAPSTSQPVATKGLLADVLDTLYAELIRVEQQVLSATRPARPAVLKGEFGYATSVLGSTEKRIKVLKDEDVTGSKRSRPVVVAKLNDVREGLESARTTQVDLSLRQLRGTVESYATQARGFTERSSGLPREPGKPREDARTQLYTDASAALTEAGREQTDWRGQINEARVSIAGTAGAFDRARQAGRGPERDRTDRRIVPARAHLAPARPQRDRAHRRRHHHGAGDRGCGRGAEGMRQQLGHRQANLRRRQDADAEARRLPQEDRR